MPHPLTELSAETHTGKASQDLTSAVSQASSTIAAEAGKSGGAGAGSSAAEHTSKEMEKAAADKIYEENIEDEYAKREGGA